MRYLPSEQEEMYEELLVTLERDGRINLDEPCNCNGRIRHNNGGNYHEEITIVKDKGDYYIKEDTTCELNEPAPWRETDIDEIKEVIKSRLAEW